MMSIAEVRLALKRNGFTPVSCIGKIPIGTGWQTGSEIPEAELARAGGGNTGVLARDTPGLDIDIRVEEAAIAVEEAAKDWFDGRGAILSRVGLPPKRLIPFKTSTPFPKIRVELAHSSDDTADPAYKPHALEVLCAGQQWIAHGPHQDTRKPYVWHGGYEPWGAIKRDDLPEITADEAQAFTKFCTEMLCEQFAFTLWKQPTVNGHDAAGDAPAPRTGPVDVERELEALAAGENANTVQPRIIPSMLRKGEHPDDVLAYVVDETMTRVGDRLGWNREAERHHVVARILSA
jgi:hypothetical protein